MHSKMQDAVSLVACSPGSFRPHHVSYSAPAARHFALRAAARLVAVVSSHIIHFISKEITQRSQRRLVLFGVRKDLSLIATRGQG